MGLHHDSATAGPQPEAAAEWVSECCRVELDEEGNVNTPIPALLAAAVTRLVEEAEAQDAAAQPGAATPAPTRLHGCRPPAIGVADYTARLLRYCKNSPVCYVAAFAYMLRLQARGGGGTDGPLRVDVLTAHRLLAVGSVVATKFYDDKYFSNQHYAQVAGVSLPEWNAMELDFLFRIEFRARVGVPELFATLRHMQTLARDASLLPPPPRAAAATACCAVPSSPVAVAVPDGSQGSFSSADTTETVLAATSSPFTRFLASAAEEEEGVVTAAALLPWGSHPGGAREAAAPEPPAPLPRRNKKRCSLEAQRHSLAGRQAELEERRRLAQGLCQA